MIPTFEQALGMIVKKTVCPTCKKEVKGKKELEFYKEVGECLNCDHLRSN